MSKAMDDTPFLHMRPHPFIQRIVSAIGFPEITVKSRISNITNCFQKAETATAFTDGVLEHRELK